MTDPSNISRRADYDPAFAAALDRFDVPPASADFIDRLAAMPPAYASALPVVARRRVFPAGRRGSWARRAVVGVVALGIASATAATTGVFNRIHIALPQLSTILAPRSAEKERSAPAHSHRPHTVPGQAAAVVDTNQRPDALGAQTPAMFAPSVTNPEVRLRRMLLNERAVTVLQNRLAARGIDVPRPVIRRKLIQNEVAIGAAIRGDMTTPLPPKMDRVRARAARYLDNHPGIQRRLRERLARTDARATAPTAALETTPAIGERAPPLGSVPIMPEANSPPRAYGPAAPSSTIAPQGPSPTPDAPRRQFRGAGAGRWAQMSPAERDAIREWRMQRWQRRMQHLDKQNRFNIPSSAEGSPPPQR